MLLVCFVVVVACSVKGYVEVSPVFCSSLASKLDSCNMERHCLSGWLLPSLFVVIVYLLMFPV